MIVGIPITGLGTMFYTVLLVAMGVAKMWRRTMALIEGRLQIFAPGRPGTNRPPGRVAPTNAVGVEGVLGWRISLPLDRETALRHPQQNAGDGGGPASPSRETGWPAVVRLVPGERPKEPEPDPV